MVNGSLLARLSPTPFWSRPFITVLVCLASTAVPGLAYAHAIGATQRAVACALWLTAMALAVAANVWRRQDTCVVLVDDGSVDLPTPWGFGRRSTRVDGDGFYCIDLSADAKVLTLGVAGSGPFRLGRRDLADGDLAAFAAALRAGAGARLEQAEALARRWRARPVIAGSVIAALLLGAHAARGLFGHGINDPVSALLVEGGFNGGLVASGQWYRLVTAGLLHGNLAHLLVNCGLVWLIAWRTEYLWRVRDFLVVFAIGVIAGFALAGTGDAEMIVGASGGVSALFGLWVHRLLSSHYHLPAQAQMASTPVVVLVGLPMALAPLPNVSVMAHAGGMLAGLAMGMLLDRSSNGVRNALAGLVALICIAAIAAGISGAGVWLKRGTDRALTLIGERPNDAPLVHLLTWYLVLRDDATPGQLRWALERLRDTGFDPVDVDETYARLWMRLDDPRQAIEALRRGLLRAPASTHVDLLVAAERALVLAHCARGPADATAIAVGGGSVRVSAPLDEVHVEVLSRTGRHWYLSLPVGRDITRRRVAEIIEGAREVYLTGSYGSIDGRTWLFSGPMLARSLADCAPRVPVNRAPISS